MQLRYNFRLYPTPGQRQALARAFGCARVVFDDGLRARREAHAAGQPYISDGALSKLVITQAKRTAERAWLSEVSAVVLQQALTDLNDAYRNFFSSISGKRAGRRVAPPQFRSRKDRRQAIRFTKNVPVRWSRRLPAEPSSVTVIRDAAGRYFASFVVEASEAPLRETGAETGIDLGLSNFAVLSDGRRIANPRFLRRAARKLRKAQKALSRKQTGSANRAKARVNVARAHARVADARRDWLHKESTRIIRENQAVYVEDLCVSGLARTKLARSVHDAGWSQFVAMLAYKAARHGRTFSKIDRWYPPTRTCSVCGVVGPKLGLNVRAWTCGCGARHDRDVNAAINILAAGRAESQNACGADVRPPHTWQPATKQEATAAPPHAAQTESPPSRKGSASSCVACG